MKEMHTHLHYILVPLFYFAVAQVGSSFTLQGVSSWYPSIITPSYTPPGAVIGAVWTIIYILSAVSLIVFANTAKGTRVLWITGGLYVLNGVVNALWSYLFFVRHMLFFSFLDALLIWLTVGLLIVNTWPYSRLSSMLLVPYFLWVSFASYLNFVIYRLN
jgi:tryptophan-rich sensory protein